MDSSRIYEKRLGRRNFNGDRDDDALSVLSVPRIDDRNARCEAITGRGWQCNAIFTSGAAAKEIN